MRRLLQRGAVVVLLASLAGACTVDEAANTARRCDEQTACGSGQQCYRGFCIPADPGADAEPGPDRDPGDAGIPDLGPLECDETVTATRSCYSYALEVLGIGECKAGFKVCQDGRFLPNCIGDRGPGPEVQCSGRDEACNGDGDEVPSGSCVTGIPGICSAGTMGCLGTEASCIQTRTATTESCNGLDDDCNGVADDQPVQCYTAPSGCTARGDGTYDCRGVCAPGMRLCTGSCAGAVEPAPLDGCTVSSTIAVDDDCDGDIDEDCACVPGEQRDCYSGPPDTVDRGQCRGGSITCVETAAGSGIFRFTDCTGEVLPAAETCANEGADDDCNGTDDDGVARRGEPCTTMADGICGAGNQACQGGQLVCATPMALPAELCNGLDDDCDGTTDETFDFAGTTHCLRCNNTCAAGESCCGQGCVDQRTDERNCGRCGNVCGGGQTCCGGTCVDTRVDENNCGACGAPACDAGETCCGGTCVDPQGDRNNCGMCGEACTGTDLCCGGNCLAPNQPACTGCPTACTGTEICCAPVDRVCSDPMRDEARCGGCGNAPCAPGSLCCGGACIPRDDTNCTDCGLGCGAGTLCCNGQCVINGPTNCNTCGNACEGDSPNCCPTGCTNLQRDPQNCGGCGAPACASGCCGGQCVNSMTDRSACGPNCADCRVLLGILGRCVNGACTL